MYRLAKFILTILVDTKIFVGLCAVLITLSTYHVLKIDPPILVLAFVFSCTHLAYTINVIFHEKKKRLDVAMFALAVFSTLVSGGFFLANVHHPSVFLCLFALVGLMLAYYLPRRHNLRSIPYIKSLAIAIAWGICTVVIPVASYSNGIDTNTLILFFERALFIFALTVPFDIKDLQVDKQQGVNTIPLRIGLKNSLALSMGLLFLYLAITFIHHGLSDILFVRFVTVWYLLVLLQGVNTSRSKYYYTGAIDGSLILQPLLTILVV